MKGIIAITIILVSLALSLVFYSTSTFDKNTSDFKAICTNAQGTPAFNGKNWECIK